MLNNAAGSAAQRFACLDDDIRTCRCRCVLLDVGLNNGDTLRTWHTTAAAALLKDGFTNASAALTRCAADERACFIGIEPNPRFTERLRTQERALRASGVRAKIYTETALALTDGFATLYAQNTSKQKVWTPYTRWTEVESVGSSLEPSKQMTGWNEKGVFFTRKWTIAGEFTGKNTGKRAEGPPPEAADYSRVRVETLGAARFLRSLMRASGMRRDAVYVKLDVEGSEVALLKGLLVTEPAALCRLGALLVEWHTTRLIGPARPPPFANSALSWMLRDASCGVPAVAWH